MKNQLKQLAKSLSDVTWERGDFEQWSDWANRMKATINVVVPQLNSIAETLVERDNELNKKVESIVKNILCEKKYSIEDVKKAIDLSRTVLAYEGKYQIDKSNINIDEELYSEQEIIDML